MLIGIFLALLSSLGISIGNVFLKKAIKNFPSFSEFFVFAVFSLLLWPLSSFFIPFDSNRFLEGLFFGTISGLLAQGYYIFVISKGELSITSTLISTYPVFIISFALIFFGETLSLIGFAALALIIIGTIIVSTPDKRAKTKTSLLLILLPLSAAIAVGFSDVLSNNYIDSAGASTFLTATALVQIPISMVLMMLNREKIGDLFKVFRSMREYKNALLGALALSIGTLFLFLSFNYAPVSIVSPIAGTAPVTTVLLAFLILKERVSRKDIVGIVLVLIGILVISFY